MLDIEADRSVHVVHEVSDLCHVVVPFQAACVADFLGERSTAAYAAGDTVVVPKPRH